MTAKRRGALRSDSAYEAYRVDFSARPTPPANAVLANQGPGAAGHTSAYGAADIFAAGHFRTVRLSSAKPKPCSRSGVLPLGACPCLCGGSHYGQYLFSAKTAIPVGLGVVFTVAILLLSLLF